MILNLNAQIIWVFVDLLILFVLMKKFLFGPITRMLDDRAQEVSDTLDQADRRLAEAEQQQTAHAAQLASAKAEAAQIIEDARARGQQEYDRLVAEARTAVQRLEEQSLGALARLLCARHGYRAVTFEIVTDETLLGGFTAEIDGVTYDKSVRGQLRALAHDL